MIIREYIEFERGKDPSLDSEYINKVKENFGVKIII